MTVYQITSLNDIQRGFHRNSVVKRGEKPIVLLVSEKKCGHCKDFRPRYEKLSEKFKGAKFYDYVWDYDDGRDHEQNLKGFLVDAFPLVFVFMPEKKGEEIDRDELPFMLADTVMMKSGQDEPMVDVVTYECGCVMSGFHVLYFFKNVCKKCNFLREQYPNCVFQEVNSATPEGQKLMNDHNISEHELPLAIILDTKELSDHRLHNALSKDLLGLVSGEQCPMSHQKDTHHCSKCAQSDE